MRVFFGILLGILLTIGTAYISDSMQSIGPEEDAAHKKMVNWDVVGRNLQGISSALQEQWARLTGHS